MIWCQCHMICPPQPQSYTGTWPNKYKFNLPINDDWIRGGFVSITTRFLFAASTEKLGEKKWKILFCPKKEYSKIIFKIVYCYYNNIVWVILWRALNACPIISLTSALYESMSSHRDWCPLGQKIWISSNMHTLVAKLPKLFS